MTTGENARRPTRWGCNPINVNCCRASRPSPSCPSLLLVHDASSSPGLPTQETKTLVSRRHTRAGRGHGLCLGKLGPCCIVYPVPCMRFLAPELTESDSW